MQKTIIHSLMLAAAGTTLPLHAANTAETANLDDVVITATRSTTPSNELATATTVYTRDDIDRLQVRTLPELLTGSPGVDLVQSGGYGQPASIYLRGTNDSHVLVLIDGIKAGSVTLGTTQFELLPMDQIERVEIIRGPQSSLYGSEAIGGVIQIFTRKGKQTEQPSIAVEAGAGSYDTHRESGTISGRWQDSWYNLGVSNLESRGFAPEVIAPAGVANQGSYDNTAVNARAGHRFQNNTEVEAFFMRADGNQQFPGFDTTAPNHKQFATQAVGTSLKMDIMTDWRSSLTFGQTVDHSQNLGSPAPANNTFFDTTRWNATWLNQIALSNAHTATLGAEYRVDEAESNTPFTKSSRYDVGVFGELHSQIFDAHFLNASLRWDDNESFGDYVTGNIGWRFNWRYGLSAFANFGNAFKAPTFNQLYYSTDAWGFHGNPNLQPESSDSVEVGFAGKHQRFQWELRAYHTDIDKLIQWGLSMPENISKAQIDGIEAEIAMQTWGWNHKLTGNILSPRDLTNHTRLLRRADKTLAYDLSKGFGNIDVGAKVLAQSDRPDIDTNFSPTNVAGFVTVDLRAAYHIDKNWMISGKLNNLLDKHYQTVHNYNMADRNFFFSIHYQN